MVINDYSLRLTVCRCYDAPSRLIGIVMGDRSDTRIVGDSLTRCSDPYIL